MGTPQPSPKTKQPFAETLAILIGIAVAVLVVALFLEWLLSGKGLLAQSKHEDSPLEEQ